MEPVKFEFFTNKLEFGSLSKGQGKTDEKFYVRGYASTPDLDRQDELITWEALKKVEDHLVKNSTLFFDHNYGKPIGRVVKSKVDEVGLFIEAYISKTQPDIRTLIEEGILNRFSIGGRILEMEPAPDLGKEAARVLDLELFEVSLVGVPANSEAKVTDYIRKAISDARKIENEEEKVADKDTKLENEEKKEEKVEEKKEEKVEDLVIKTTEEEVESVKDVKDTLKQILDSVTKQSEVVEQYKPTIYISSEDFSKVNKMEVGDKVKMEIIGKVKYLSEDETSKSVSIELDDIEFVAKKLEVEEKKEEKVEEKKEEKVEEKKEEKVEEKKEEVVEEKKPEVKEEAATRKGVQAEEKEEDTDNAVVKKLEGKSLSQVINDETLFESLPEDIQEEIKKQYKLSIIK